MKGKMLFSALFSFYSLVHTQAQTGLPIWPLGVPGSSNNDVVLDFAHNFPVITAGQIPNTMQNMTPVGTGVGLDACGNLDLYFLPQTTTFLANPSGVNNANTAAFQENFQEMRIYDASGNSLQLMDNNWNSTNAGAYPYYLDACAGDREIQVIPRKNLAPSAPLQWFVIYNEPYVLQPSDLNTTNGVIGVQPGYGYTDKNFGTIYRPSKIKYSLIEYDPNGHPATPLRRVQPDQYLTYTAIGKPNLICTYMQGKATDIPDANGNYKLYVAFVNQLTCSGGNWSGSVNVVLHQFLINSTAGTITYAQQAFSKTGNQLAMNVGVDGYLVGQSSIELGKTGTDDYKVAVNLRHEAGGLPDFILFSKSFSAPPRVLSLQNQRIGGMGGTTVNGFGAPAGITSFAGDISNKVGGIEWDPTGQFLYLTSGNGAANFNAYLIQLNTLDYQAGTPGTYGLNVRNQDRNAANGYQYAIGDIERGYNDQLFITKTNFSAPSSANNYTLWTASPTLFWIDPAYQTTAFQSLVPGQDIDFNPAKDFTVSGLTGGYGLIFMPDGIDGYDYSNSQVIKTLDPDFSLTATNPSGTGTTLIVSVTTPALPPCGNFWWQVCETDVNGNVLSCMTNPSAWWQSSQIPTCTFPGYTFLKGHYYSITRGVYGCCTPWSQKTKTINSNTLPGQNPVVAESDKYVPMPENLISNREALIIPVTPVEQKFNLYPNPSQGIMQLDYDLGENQRGEFLISDMTGRVISRYPLVQGQTLLRIQENGLGDGLYLYSVLISDKQAKTGKFSILH